MVICFTIVQLSNKNCAKNKTFSPRKYAYFKVETTLLHVSAQDQSKNEKDKSLKNALKESFNMSGVTHRYHFQVSQFFTFAFLSFFCFSSLLLFIRTNLARFSTSGIFEYFRHTSILGRFQVFL